jgi:transposase-like protein
MKRYRRAAREELTRDYQNSGLPAWQYCQQNGLSETSLQRWIKEFQTSLPETQDTLISLVEIQVQKSNRRPKPEIQQPMATIRFPNGMVIEIGHGTDISWIGQIMDLVGQIA